MMSQKPAFTRAALLCCCMFGGAVVAQAPDPLQWYVDKALFPKGYGVLASEQLLYPVDQRDWPVKIDNTIAVAAGDDELRFQAGRRQLRIEEGTHYDYQNPTA